MSLNIHAVSKVSALFLTPLLSFAQSPVFADPVVNIMDFSAVCDGANDDTSAIQAAAATVPDAGGTLLFPVGVCSVSDTTRLKSNTHVLGQGATIRNLPPKNWRHGVEGAFKIDAATNVTIEGMRFAWQHGVYNGGAAHIIEATNSRNVVIRDNVSDGGGDFAAAIGSADVLMEGNRVTEVDNACYDSWGGSHRIRVIDNTCVTTAREHPGVGAVQFTGINTDGTPAANSGFYASGNTVTINTPKGQAFEINGSPKGGTDKDITITHNRIIIGAQAWGVLVTYASHGKIIHNTIESIVPNIFGALFVADTSADWEISDNEASHIPAGPNPVFTNNGVGGAIVGNRAFKSPAARLLGQVGVNVMVSGNILVR